MTPAEARKQQTQKPQLPDGWGGTLSQKQRYPRGRAPVVQPRFPPNLQSGTASWWLLAHLYEIADRGERLPSRAALAEILAITGPGAARQVGDLLTHLCNNGCLLRSPHSGARTWFLPRSGQEIRE